jgi:RNA polymerase sigma-54 factor
MQAAIEEILKTEDKNHPLSDAMIKQQLQEKGILLSRRTITEYRKHLQIPASSARQTT